MLLQPEDCEFATQKIRNFSIAGVCASLFAANLALRPLVARACAKVELSSEAAKHGETREMFTLHSTINLVGVCFHSFLGPYAAYNTIMYRNVDVVDTLSAASSIVSTDACALAWHAGFAGTTFTGYAMYQIVQVIIGWEEIALDNVVHHICFGVLGLTVCNFCFFAEVACAGVAMESSSPLLLVHLTFRSLRGFDKVTLYSKVMFAVSFCFFRVFLFGVAVWRFLGLWITRPEAIQRFLNYVPRFVLNGVRILYFAGWVLQAYWAVSVIHKFLCSRRVKRLVFNDANGD